jgi:hypothetical protein
MRAVFYENREWFVTDMAWRLLDESSLWARDIVMGEESL